MLPRLQRAGIRIPVLRTSVRRRFATDHQLNINFSLIKAEEGKKFSELRDHPVMTLQGIGPKHSKELEQLGLRTIQQMADYKFFHLAKAIQTMAALEEAGNRSETSEMNLNRGLDKAFETYALRDLLEQPVDALQGLTPAAGETLASLGVKNIENLANFKYCHWAEAIATAGKFQE